MSTIHGTSNIVTLSDSRSFDNYDKYMEIYVWIINAKSRLLEGIFVHMCLHIGGSKGPVGSSHQDPIFFYFHAVFEKKWPTY